ncbi:Probable RNA-directed DNA polymerase from transposon X-element [Eumeta japonica]|uniref:Probable RNA-directed DNA polymerase from transposon X-element n=1 Tax=Eumeta variegata TaxID=151549 RepID=A0A4C1YQN5_EUMVA|nr:Probable RNA-directed DNA polymerase from transposon X-element [Eumeta japonica]
MEEIRPSHKAFWKITKALKMEGYTPVPPLKRPDGSIALDDAEVGECIADSIETQCSYASPPHEIAHINSIEEEVLQKTSLEPKDDLTPVSPWHAGVPQGSALSPLLYSAYTNDIPRPTSGVQLALFTDDTVLFFRSRDRHSIFRHLPRAIDELGQWFQKWRIEVNPEKSAVIQFKYSKHRSKFVVDDDITTLKMLNAKIPWQRSYKYLGVTLDRNLNFRDHIAQVRKTTLFYTARLGTMLSRKSKLSRRNKRTLYKMCIRTVLTYACPVFAHAAPKALHRLQVIQNKFCRAATDAHWYVRNSILHRDLEHPTISKYMKDASKLFFDIAGSHPNALLRATVDYQPPHPTHLIRRPRNVLTDPPDALTAAFESLNNVNNTHG